MAYSAVTVAWHHRHEIALQDEPWYQIFIYYLFGAMWQACGHGTYMSPCIIYLLLLISAAARVHRKVKERINATTDLTHLTYP